MYVCMHVYIYTCTYTYVCMYVCMHVYIHTYYVYKHTYMQWHIGTGRKECGTLLSQPPWMPRRSTQDGVEATRSGNFKDEQQWVKTAQEIFCESRPAKHG